MQQITSFFCVIGCKKITSLTVFNGIIDCKKLHHILSLAAALIVTIASHRVCVLRKLHYLLSLIALFILQIASGTISRNVFDCKFHLLAVYSGKGICSYLKLCWITCDDKN